MAKVYALSLSLPIVVCLCTLPIGRSMKACVYNDDILRKQQCPPNAGERSDSLNALDICRQRGLATDTMRNSIPNIAVCPLASPPEHPNTFQYHLFASACYFCNVLFSLISSNLNSILCIPHRIVELVA